MRDQRHASIIVDLNFRMSNDAQQKKNLADDDGDYQRI